jgi:hypothetical protein
MNQMQRIVQQVHKDVNTRMEKVQAAIQQGFNNMEARMD